MILIDSTTIRMEEYVMEEIDYLFSKTNPTTIQTYLTRDWGLVIRMRGPTYGAELPVAIDDWEPLHYV